MQMTYGFLKSPINKAKVDAVLILGLRLLCSYVTTDVHFLKMMPVWAPNRFDGDRRAHNIHENIEQSTSI